MIAMRLYKGPRFNQLILDILLRFQVFKHALTADLEKAFLQVSITEDYRDVLRFLWVDDIHKDCPEICLTPHSSTTWTSRQQLILTPSNVFLSLPTWTIL